MTGEPFELLAGDCRDRLAGLDDASVDACVTDPPYELGFMSGAGVGWDSSGIACDPEVWAQVLRVLRPGGHLLCFGGTRSFHRVMCAVEDAGFELRDGIAAWLYGQGMPKSRGLLKPAWEPIIVARKPSASGSAPLNIDAARVPAADGDRDAYGLSGTCRGGFSGVVYGAWVPARVAYRRPDAGRWPANAVLSHHPLCVEGEACVVGCWVAELDAQEAEASRFFPVFRYHAKAGAAERPEVGGVAHPTVKPLGLIRWLVRLAAPAGGVVLDPFLGSGTTAEAALLEGVRCVGCEREPDFLPLIASRLSRIGFGSGAAETLTSASPLERPDPAEGPELLSLFSAADQA